MSHFYQNYKRNARCKNKILLILNVVSPCEVENGGCDENCHWDHGSERTCSCNKPNVIDPEDQTYQHCGKIY